MTGNTSSPSFCTEPSSPSFCMERSAVAESIVPHGAWQHGPCDFAQGDGSDFAQGDGNDFAEDDGSGRLMSFKEATA
ncbi:hypothetical protein [Halothiobacillus sp.]|uniref:hypothetical protein n=1 Tax=Halothiobacillus sp. TaxID=1891311 RepID=UPI00260BC6F5|nr:hypothetical protein [Halothiobacillus sp.]MDD4965335.1 hypothetical protein [Halothiobacillus sp.]